MEISNAKKILSVYQPGDDASADPQLLSALKLLETDQELAEWFKAQQNVDEQIKSALGSAPEPLGLKNDILSALENESNESPTKSNLIFVRFLAMAAAVIAITLIGAFSYITSYNNKMEDYAHFRSAMSHYASGAYFLLDYNESDLNKISNWLSENETPHWENIPPALLATNPLGCKALEWKGQPVSLVCFHEEDGDIVHMFVMERSGLSEEAFADLERVALSHELETGGWVTDDYVYLLSGSEPGVSIEPYMASI